jgi:uncharacterized membrane protein YedE/YeeE
METEFTPILALAGGGLIGIASVLLMLMHGRIAGMTGILGGILPPVSRDWPWRAAFLGGSILAPALFLATGGDIPFEVPVSTAALVIGGVIVGFGATLGSGCTSGHGVCGMARLSPRSIVATAVFMISTFATVYVVRHVFAGV